MSGKLIYKSRGTEVYWGSYSTLCPLCMNDFPKLIYIRGEGGWEGREVETETGSLTSFGSKEMKSRWNWGSMTDMICLTWDGSHFSINSSIAKFFSASDQCCRGDKIEQRKENVIIIFILSLFYVPWCMVPNLHSYTARTDCSSIINLIIISRRLGNILKKIQMLSGTTNHSTVLLHTCLCSAWSMWLQHSDAIKQKIDHIISHH